MSPLVESIKVVNRQLQNLPYHNARMNSSRREFFGDFRMVDLQDIVHIPHNLSNDVHKCRIIYTKSEIEKVEFLPYTKRKVEHVKVVYDDFIEYTYKYVNREHLEKLFDRRGACDDIIIVKLGFVTDGFSSNLAFYDGKKWDTPSTPLLKGTKRQYLIEQGILNVKPIKVDGIKGYEKVSFINAMVDLDEISVGLGSIFF